MTIKGLTAEQGRILHAMQGLLPLAADIAQARISLVLPVTEELEAIKLKIKKTKREIYAHLTPWQKVKLARHPRRPYALDYIQGIFNYSALSSLFFFLNKEKLFFSVCSAGFSLTVSTVEMHHFLNFILTLSEPVSMIIASSSSLMATILPIIPPIVVISSPISSEFLI